MADSICEMTRLEVEGLLEEQSVLVIETLGAEQFQEEILGGI